MVLNVDPGYLPRLKWVRPDPQSESTETMLRENSEKIVLLDLMTVSLLKEDRGVLRFRGVIS